MAYQEKEGYDSSNGVGSLNPAWREVPSRVMVVSPLGKQSIETDAE